MNNPEKDPLQKLIVREAQVVNKQELADLLIPYVSICEETGNFDFSNAFMDLKNCDKILILLAAMKAKNLIFGTDDKLSPSDMIRLDFVPEGSIKSSLKRLSDNNQIKSEKGKYFLPSYKIHQIINQLKK